MLPEIFTCLWSLPLIFYLISLVWRITNLFIVKLTKKSKCGGPFNTDGSLVNNRNVRAFWMHYHGVLSQ